MRHRGLLAVVRREFFPRSRPKSPSIEKTYVDEWASLKQKGLWFGSRTAPLVLVEFADLECPACRDFQHVLRRLRSHYGDSLAVLHSHLPLAQHRFAKQAGTGMCGNGVPRRGLCRLCLCETGFHWFEKLDIVRIRRLGSR